MRKDEAAACCFDCVLGCVGCVLSRQREMSRLLISAGELGFCIAHANRHIGFFGGAAIDYRSVLLATRYIMEVRERVNKLLERYMVFCPQ